MGENNKLTNEFYRTLQRFHNCKPKFKGNGDLANVEFFMLMGLSMLLDMKECEEKGVTLGEIMKTSGMSVSAASKKISILEKKGYVERRPSKDDRRFVTLNLLPKGQERFEIIEHDMYFKFKDVFEQIAPDKQEQVIEALKLYNEACLKVENEKYD